MSDTEDRKWNEEREEREKDRIEKRKDRQVTARNALIAGCATLLVPVVAWGLGRITNNGSNANAVQNFVTGVTVIAHVISPVQPVVKVSDENRLNSAPSPSTKPASDQPVILTPPVPGPSRVLLDELRTSLADPNSDNQEAAAQDAINKAKDEASRLLVLRAIYRTNKPALRSMAILNELKSLEGKQIPLSFLFDTPVKSADPGAATADDALATSLIGSIISIKTVDLPSGSFSGSYLTGHGLARDVKGTVTNDGVQFASIVDMGYNNPLSLQVIVSPGNGDFRLRGRAIGVLGGKQLTTAVDLPLPM